VLCFQSRIFRSCNPRHYFQLGIRTLVAYCKRRGASRLRLRVFAIGLSFAWSTVTIASLACITLLLSGTVFFDPNSNLWDTLFSRQRSKERRRYHEWGIVTFRFKCLQSSHLSTPLAETIFEMTVHDTSWDFDGCSTSGQHGRLYMNEASKAARPHGPQPHAFHFRGFKATNHRYIQILSRHCMCW
jgi:hypothetical protein